MRRVVLIVNPYASGVSDERAAAVERALARAAAVDTVRTQHPLHATELAREARDADALVVFSGDGGFNEVLNGVDDARLPVGFVPGGGTSVLPRALGLPRDPVRAAERLADSIAVGRTRTISLGRVDGRRFGFSAALGLVAEVVRRVDAYGRTVERGRVGDLRFTWTFARALAERRFMYDPVLEIDGRGRAALLLVANGDPYSYAGRVPLRAAPQADFEQGVDVFAPRRVRPWTLPRLLASIVSGRGHASLRDVLQAHDLDRFVVRCDAPLALQVDGEDLGDVTEALFEAERAAVSVLV